METDSNIIDSPIRIYVFIEKFATLVSYFQSDFTGLKIIERV